MGDSQKYALRNSPQIAKKERFTKIFVDIVEKQFRILYGPRNRQTMSVIELSCTAKKTHVQYVSKTTAARERQGD